LPVIVGSILVKPVMLPPGRGKLATNPLPTGSETMAKDEVRLQRHKFLRESLQQCRIGCGPANVEPYLAAVGPPELLEFLPKRRDKGLSLRVVLGRRHQHADSPHPVSLLRACGNRPCRRAA
jgi:hypothetical protein